MSKKTNKILIAEDDPFIGKITKKNLEQAGYEVMHVADGESALSDLKENEYDLILLDLIMPNRDGFNVLEELKKLKIKTPVLVFSNLAQEEDRKEAIALGATDYFVKSDMTMQNLMKIVKKHTS